MRLMTTFLVAFLVSCEGYKILFLCPVPSKSHGILGDAIVKFLVGAGHHVTYVSVFPNNDTEQVKYIDVSSNIKILPSGVVNIKLILDKLVDLGDIAIFKTLVTDLSIATIKNEHLLNIINDPRENFDLVLAEYAYSDLYSGLAAVFGCPFAWFTTTEPDWFIMHVIDGLPNPAYTSDAMSNNVPPFTFAQRVKSLVYQMRKLLKYRYKFDRENEAYQELIAPAIRKRGKSVPEYEELIYNTSLVLGNSHLSMGEPMSLPQLFKPIGGYHIEKHAKALPENLQKIMDEAEHGVIYFSMGSNLKSKDFPDDMKMGLMRILGQFKQTVLWKFEESSPDMPKNVHILDWAPQQSILAHPNCRLFITHGGLLSTTEAIHFGVPIIGIPAFADQFVNVERAEKKGFAKKVPLSYSLVEDLKEAITEMLSNPRYTEKVKQLSFIYHDRPVSPGAELVHWVEHVVKTRGALHLRSPALMLPWYQKMYLDLGIIVLAIGLLVIYCIRWLILYIYRLQPKSSKKTN